MIGRMIAHYRVLEILGQGGMGVVYKAHDTHLNRHVAIKVLPGGSIRNPEGKRRFVQEAKAASALNHPNIITIYDIDEVDGVDFIAMEYVAGKTLGAMIPPGGMSLAEALKCAAQIAGALTAAHAAGIIHRDLKPSNIMVNEQGRLKVLDFGLAKLIEPLGRGEDTTRTAAGYTRDGAILGTVAYMAPEQAEGKPVDQRADVFTLGLVLYEMLSGRQPFRRDSTLGTLTAILRDEPPALESLRPDTPQAVCRIVERALRKTPGERYASAGELAADLAAAQNSVQHPGWRKRRRVLAGAASAVLAVAALGGWSLYRQSRIHWATNEGLPEIARLLAEERGLAAFDLLQEVKKIIPDDPQLQQLWPEVACTPLIETDPPGAEIYLSEMGAEQKPWRRVGTAPMHGVPLPHGYFRWKAIKPGFAEATGAACTWWGRIRFRLASQSEVPAGMVLVPGAEALGGTIAVIASDEAPQESFFIDRFEVTSRQYKDFVDRGGYDKREYWKVPFSKDGRSLSWEEAMGEFRDATGRPGPSTWEGGTFPAGKDEFPVSGVSWYEAAAYAEFAGKTLPTVFHWYRAADIRTTPFVIPASNFGGNGTASVGTYKGIGPFGTFDMAGNVQEWSWNETDNRFRFILGGAWSSPTYLFNEPDAKPPFDRSPMNGFRCARYTKPPPESLLAVKLRSFRDYSREKPVGDEAFRVIRGSYYYEPKDLKASVDEVDDSSPYWRKEKVSFEAAYGAERVPAFLFLPKNAKPPYQALVYHPGAGAQSGTLASLEGLSRVEFIVRSGRAVIYPILIGTYNRRLPPRPTGLELKVRTVRRYQDMKQSAEYLLTRGDIDSAKLGYVGASWGAAWAPVMVSLEDRFKAAVLFEGGLYLRAYPFPEIDIINFLPRFRIPILMLNGRYDYTFPLAASQQPYFRWLGTPEKDKRHIVYDTAHDVMVLRTKVVREVLSWLDEHLGPVAR